MPRVDADTCPDCGEDMIHATVYTWDADGCLLDLTCEVCGTSWSVEYTRPSED